MPTCPSGHDSEAVDYCDKCGLRIGAPDPPPDDRQPAPDPAEPDGDGAGPPCPRCGAPRDGKFCEACGFDFTSPVTPAAPAAPAAPGAGLSAAAVAVGGPGGEDGAAGGAGGEAAGGPRPEPGEAAHEWMAVVVADRARFDAVAAMGTQDEGGLSFPAYCPERRFPLRGSQMRIGRRSVSRGLEPEIDLTGPPTDPGVSRLQAILLSQPDGGWAVLDPGSANGTLVNGREISVGEPVPLSDGDRIHLGAWTLMTLHKATR